MNKYNIGMAIVLVLLLGTTFSAYSDDYFSGLACEQEISTVKELSPVYTNLTSYVLYEKDGDHISIGDVESTLINYVFWEDKFYGKVIAICGAENFNEVLRYLQNTYGHPITIEQQRITMWMTPELVFRVKRFSYHQGQLDILCRDLFFELEMSDEQTNS